MLKAVWSLREGTGSYGADFQEIFDFRDDAGIRKGIKEIIMQLSCQYQQLGMAAIVFSENILYSLLTEYTLQLNLRREGMRQWRF